MKRKLNVVGKKLKLAREALKLTQNELAAKCGVLGWDIERVTIAKIEALSRSVYDAELVVLSNALKADLSQLLPKQINDPGSIACLNKPRRRRK